MIDATLTMAPPPAATIERAAARAEEDRRQVDVDDGLPVGERQLQRRAPQRDAGVVDQHVDAAAARDHSGESAVDGGFVGDVERFADVLDAALRQLAAGRGERRLVAVEQHRHGALGDERVDGRATDALRPTRHDRHPAGRRRSRRLHAAPPRQPS
jgi:hypothetical protein